MKKHPVSILVVTFFVASIAHAQEALPDVEAGVDRWKIKTSMIASPAHHTVALH